MGFVCNEGEELNKVTHGLNVGGTPRINSRNRKALYLDLNAAISPLWIAQSYEIPSVVW